MKTEVEPTLEESSTKEAAGHCAPETEKDVKAKIDIEAEMDTKEESSKVFPVYFGPCDVCTFGFESKWTCNSCKHLNEVWSKSFQLSDKCTNCAKTRNFVAECEVHYLTLCEFAFVERLHGSLESISHTKATVKAPSSECKVEADVHHSDGRHKVVVDTSDAMERLETDRFGLSVLPLNNSDEEKPEMTADGQYKMYACPFCTGHNPFPRHIFSCVFCRHCDSRVTKVQVSKNVLLTDDTKLVADVVLPKGDATEEDSDTAPAVAGGGGISPLMGVGSTFAIPPTGIVERTDAPTTTTPERTPPLHAGTGTGDVLDLDDGVGGVGDALHGGGLTDMTEMMEFGRGPGFEHGHGGVAVGGGDDVLDAGDCIDAHEGDDEREEEDTGFFVGGMSELNRQFAHLSTDAVLPNLHEDDEDPQIFHVFRCKGCMATNNFDTILCRLCSRVHTEEEKLEGEGYTDVFSDFDSF